MFKRKDVLITLWMTFITVVAWIGFSIYHIWITSTISEIDVSAIAPINPDFDTNVINTLKSRENIAPLYYYNGIPASPSSSEEAIIIPTQTASSEAIIVPISETRNEVPLATGSP